MSRQFRYRVAATVLCGLVFGAPMLAGETANAEQVPESARQVTFEGGGALGLSCRSRPDTESMVVPANSMIRLVNRTGYAAELKLDGHTKRTLPDRSATQVVFRRGITEVLLKPSCPVRGEVRPVQVTAAPSEPPANPPPAPEPTGASPGVLTVDPSGTATPSRAGSSPPGHSSAGHPSRPAKASTREPSAGRIVPRRARPVPRHGATSRFRTGPNVKSHSKPQVRTPVRTLRSRAPASAGMLPGDVRTAAPGVPGHGLVPLPRTAVPSASLPPSAAESVAAEAVSRVQPLPDRRPVGLLALIAVVCAMGVGAAAIRAIVSQRANRSKIA